MDGHTQGTRQGTTELPLSPLVQASPCLLNTVGCCLQVYGKNSVFDADRLIDLLAAFEDFAVASKSARGDMDVAPPRPGASFTLPPVPGARKASLRPDSRAPSSGQARTSMTHNSVNQGHAASNGQAGARAYYNGNGVGSYSGVNKSDGRLVADGRGNDYQASRRSGAGRAAGGGFNGAAAHSGTYNGAAANSGRASNGNGVDTGAYGIQPYNGQARMAGSASGQFGAGQNGQTAASDRRHSGQHASSSPGNPWGSWGDWSSQVGSRCARHVT